MTGCKDCKYLKTRYEPLDEVKVIWARNKVVCFCLKLDCYLGRADRRKDVVYVHRDCPLQ